MRVYVTKESWVVIPTVEIVKKDGEWRIFLCWLRWGITL